MDYKRRLDCQVRLLDHRGSPKGCGFICGDRQVMTCTHVVDSCLRNASSPIITAMFPGSPGHRARLTVLKSYPPIAASAGEDGLARDIAVLELEKDSTFPAEFSVASSSLSVLEEHAEFRGTGIAEGYLAGVQFAGETGEYVDHSRVFVASWEEDQAVQPGCSGAALFHRHEGVIGMVAEVQQVKTGLIIPIQILRRVWPVSGNATAHIATIPTAPAAASEPLNKRLLREFSRFDRAVQTSEFRGFFDDRWTENKAALICAIAGIEADLPRHCRDKFRNHDLKDFFRRNDINASKVDALEITWPRDEKRFEPESMFARMRGELAVHLNASGNRPDQIRQALNTDLRPLIFYSQIDERNFGRSHLALLQKWAAYFSEIDDETIDRPLVHFLIVRLEAGDFRPSNEQPTALLTRSYRELVTGANRELPADAEIRATSLLGYFDIDFLDNWLEMNADIVGIDQDRLEELRDDARQAFSNESYIRLKDVESWMKTVAG